MHVVWLVELRSVPGDVLGVEVIVGSRHQSFVVDYWFLIGLFSGERVPSWFLFVDISVLFLLVSADTLEVFLEFLSGCKPW
jgi:hypothetical protein